MRDWHWMFIIIIIILNVRFQVLKFNSIWPYKWLSGFCFLLWLHQNPPILLPAHFMKQSKKEESQGEEWEPEKICYSLAKHWPIYKTILFFFFWNNQEPPSHQATKQTNSNFPIIVYVLILNWHSPTLDCFHFYNFRQKEFTCTFPTHTLFFISI